MIYRTCPKCHQEKPRECFKTPSSVYRQRCAECYAKWKFEKHKNPQARCSNCEKIFDLDFQPLQDKGKIPEKWICEQCKIIIN